MKGCKLRKAPCRICRKWFTPNPRLGKRQKTCGNPDCQRQWHAKKCAEWNKKNPEYFKENYLINKIDSAQKNMQKSNDSRDKKNNFPPQKTLTNLKLPRKYIQEVIGLQALVLIEYFERLLIKRVKEVIRT